MKIRKRHLAIPLTAVLIAGFLNFVKDKPTKAADSVKIKTADSIEINPVKTEEFIIYQKEPIFYKKPTLKELDKRKPLFISKKQLASYVDSLYSEIKMPEEIPKDIFKRIIRIESGRNIYARKIKTNARGLGQLRKIAWDELEKEIPYEDGVYDPEINLKVSLKHLRWDYYYNRC